MTFNEPPVQDQQQYDIELAEARYQLTHPDSRWSGYATPQTLTRDIADYENTVARYASYLGKDDAPMSQGIVRCLIDRYLAFIHVSRELLIEQTAQAIAGSVSPAPLPARPVSFTTAAAEQLMEDLA